MLLRMPVIGRKKCRKRKGASIAPKSPVFYAGIAVICASLLAIVHMGFRPAIGPVTYTFDNGAVRFGTHPLFIAGESRMLHATVPVVLSPLDSKQFRIHPDDCIKELSINGVRVPDAIAQFCDYTELGPKVDVARYLQPGRNVFEFLIEDKGGLTGVRITPVQSTAFRWLRAIAFIALIFSIVQLLSHLRVWRGADSTLLSIIAVGVILRILYVLATPYTLRGHDTWAHIQYIRYMSTHFRIPPAAEGWEYHQAPLYYFITGAWMRFGRFIGIGEEGILNQVQIFSLLISIATLAVGVWIGSLIFPQKNQRVSRLLFCGGIAVFPSLIFLSSRITNDGLYHLVAFCAVGFLLRWWRSARSRDWFLLCVFVALSFLTKVSGLVFLPVIFCSLVAFPGWSFREKLQKGSIGLLLIILLTWWLPVGRFFLEPDPQNSITFGSQAMHPGLRVPTTLTNLITFDPIAVLRVPYNSPWNDANRRQYFLEYFFRSAFFGEFTFPDHVRFPALSILLLAMPLFFVMVIGFLKNLTANLRAFLPLLLLGAFVFTAHIFYRIRAPFASNQDFRFSVILLIPIVCFLVVTIENAGERTKSVLRSFFCAFGISTVLFIIML